MKDPAALLYIDKWIVATFEMKADARGYYMDLILSQFDKGSLPNDIEELASICRVRFSEFKHFEHVFEHVLKQKFEVNEEGRLENSFAREIIQKRQKFLDKRSNAGKWSYIIRFCSNKLKLKNKDIEYIKSNLNIDEIDLKDEQKLEHMFKQMLKQKDELYINEDENKNIIFDIFYDKEILLSNNDINYINFVKVIFGENTLSKKLDRVLKMQEQVTFEQFKVIYQYKEKYKVTIGEYLVRMENWKELNKKNTSVQLTLLNWIRKEKEK